MNAIFSTMDDIIRKELDISSSADPGYTAMEMGERRIGERSVS